MEQCSGGQQKTNSSTRKSKKVPILEEDQEVLDRKSINHLGAENIEQEEKPPSPKVDNRKSKLMRFIASNLMKGTERRLTIPNKKSLDKSD